MVVADALLDLLGFYLACGLLVGIAFLTVGVSRVDSAARGTSSMFRLLLLPGAVTLWPLLAARWIQAVKRGANP